MNKIELLSGIFGFICLASLSIGVGTILLYNQGDALSLSVVFLTVFGTSFFISGIKNQNKITVDVFVQDLFLGIGAVLFPAVALWGGSYESMALVASMSIFVVVILKVK